MIEYWDPAILYKWGILLALLGTLLHLLVLLAFQRRVAPWRAKVVYALGSVIFFSWLFFRVWDAEPRGWPGTIAVFLYALGLLYLMISYRRAPYNGGNANAK